MRPGYLVSIAFLVVVSLCGSVAADISFTYTSGNLAARATFGRDGTDLLVTLENISTYDVMLPVEILTGVYFDLGGVTLTPVSVVLTDGSVVLFPVVDGSDGLDENDELGGEYAFRDDLTSAPASIVMASAGLDDRLGPPHLFPGGSLWTPDSPDGLGYGLTSAGDDSGTGNSKVTGEVPLVQNGVVFRLSGLPEVGFSVEDIHNVEFNYGTEFNPTPVPGAALLGMIGLGLVRCLGRRHFGLSGRGREPGRTE